MTNQRPPVSPKSRKTQAEARQALVAREQRVLELRKAGLSWAQIGESTGYSQAGAYEAFQRALYRAPMEKVAEIRATCHLQLADIWRQVMAIAADPGPHLTMHGRIVVDESGQPLVDKKLRLDALSELRRLQESTRKLHGIDAPSRVRVEVIPPEVLEADTERMNQLIRAAEIELGVSADALPDAPGFKPALENAKKHKRNGNRPALDPSEGAT